VDAASWAKRDSDARAIVAAAFQQRLVTLDEMLGVLGRMRRPRRRALVLETTLDAAGGSQSITEVDFLKLCRSNGLPIPTRQVARTDSDGRQRYLDALFEEYQLVVEIDGSHHLDPKVWWDDMKRQNAIWIDGARILRFPAWLIRAEPEQVAEQIKAALRAAGWRPRSGSWD
jgi:hypothetical protein